MIKELGYSDFLRYIRHFEEGHGEDYLKDQDDISLAPSAIKLLQTVRKNPASFFINVFVFSIGTQI